MWLCTQLTLLHSVAKILNHVHCKSIVVVNLYLRPGSFHCRGLFRFQVVPPELSYFMSAQGCIQLQAPADCVQGASATCRESRQKGRLVVAGAAVREAPRSGTPGVSQSKNVRLAYKLPGQASRHRASAGFCPRETQAAEQRHRRRGMSTTDFQSHCQQVCRALKGRQFCFHICLADLLIATHALSAANVRVQQLSRTWAKVLAMSFHAAAAGPREDMRFESNRERTPLCSVTQCLYS